MRYSLTTNQLPGVAAGIAVGLSIACLCPHEPAYATTGDRAPRFSMVTVPVSDAAVGIVDPIDGVFVLDLVTGQLKGAVLNRQNGRFTSFYFRDLAKDFDVDPNLVPEFCMVTGFGQIPNQAGIQMSSGIIYIGELNTGLVHAYSFPWKEKGGGGPVQIIPIDTFSWKKVVK
jgi:hypothetical protein